MQAISLTRQHIAGIYRLQPHNAFTDLCRFNQTLMVCFRSASNHISPDGCIHILSIDSKGDQTRKTTLRQYRVDLRDPKLSVTPSGQLQLLVYGRHYTRQGKHAFSQTYLYTSQDGISWSAPRAIGRRNWWLWRLQWHQQTAYGFAYNRKAQRVDFYAGIPGRTFECIQPSALGLASHGLGYPNESDIQFASDGKAWAIVRRDADNGSAQLGWANAPYKKWHWQSTKVYLGGPVMRLVDDETALVAGRVWFGHEPKTVLMQLQLQTATLALIDILPSAGDSSYPGLIQHNNEWLLSYYSSHIGNQSAIYLARYAQV